VTGATPISPSASTPSRAAASRAYATWVSVRRSRCQCGLVGSGCGVRCRCVTVWRLWLGSVAEREQRWTFVLPLQSTHEGSSPHQLRASGRGSGLRRDKPTIKGDEVLVKVHATTVNRTDCGFRAAKPFFIRSPLGCCPSAQEQVLKVCLADCRANCRLRGQARVGRRSGAGGPRVGHHGSGRSPPAGPGPAAGPTGQCRSPAGR
jgi:hypothetical protein